MPIELLVSRGVVVHKDHDRHDRRDAAQGVEGEDAGMRGARGDKVAAYRTSHHRSECPSPPRVCGDIEGLPATAPRSHLGNGEFSVQRAPRPAADAGG